MNRKWIESLILGSAFVFSAGIARAQETAPAPPPPPGSPGMQVFLSGGPGGDVMFGFGGGIELLGFGGMHGGKVVTGAPFSATAVSETTQTLADGNHISRKTQSNVFRDSEGRFRREITLSGFGPMAGSEQPKSFVVINDPVARATFMLHPSQKTAEKMGRPFARRNGPMNQAMRENRELRQE